MNSNETSSCQINSRLSKLFYFFVYKIYYKFSILKICIGALRKVDNVKLVSFLLRTI